MKFNHGHISLRRRFKTSNTKPMIMLQLQRKRFKEFSLVLFLELWMPIRLQRTTEQIKGARQFTQQSMKVILSNYESLLGERFTNDLNNQFLSTEN